MELEIAGSAGIGHGDRRGQAAGKRGGGQGGARAERTSRRFSYTTLASPPIVSEMSEPPSTWRVYVHACVRMHMHLYVRVDMCMHGMDA